MSSLKVLVSDESNGKGQASAYLGAPPKSAALDDTDYERFSTLLRLRAPRGYMAT